VGGQTSLCIAVTAVNHHWRGRLGAILGAPAVSIAVASLSAVSIALSISGASAVPVPVSVSVAATSLSISIAPLPARLYVFETPFPDVATHRPSRSQLVSRMSRPFITPLRRGPAARC
jgi:uncharacterized membrane protein